MLCPKCNYRLDVSARRCPVCGARVFDADAENALKQERERERREREANENRQRAENEHREREQRERESAKERERATREDDEPIHVDPRKTFMHEGGNQREFGFGDLFGDFFGGGFFGGSMFGGQRRSSARFGGGLFDIIDNLFGFGGTGGYDDNRAKIEAPHEFYQLDEYDEHGFPIIRKDKLVDISQHQLEKMQKQDKRNKRKDKH